ncbi:proline-rich receptor-like protein kinase PERK2 [Penaeus japonicus]|uniref:proline-rich receptor-like protein kinase PERK2 n=1 Tax=Penaeus japonicus TaxID=27405 RepID=UPI001C711DFA|nr:proline-rich receptor-like protein kinase PERK2 [Penaeus japonicus]
MHRRSPLKGILDHSCHLTPVKPLTLIRSACIDKSTDTQAGRYAGRYAGSLPLIRSFYDRMYTVHQSQPDWCTLYSRRAGSGRAPGIYNPTMEASAQGLNPPEPPGHLPSARRATRQPFLLFCGYANFPRCQPACAPARPVERRLSLPLSLPNINPNPAFHPNPTCRPNPKPYLKPGFNPCPRPSSPRTRDSLVVTLTLLTGPSPPPPPPPPSAPRPR